MLYLVVWIFFLQTKTGEPAKCEFDENNGLIMLVIAEEVAVRKWFYFFLMLM